MKIVNFRVSDDEHKLMHAVAQIEGLNLTAYIRRHFILQSRVLGLAPDPVPQSVHAPKPSGKQHMDARSVARAAFLSTVEKPNDGREYDLATNEDGDFYWMARPVARPNTAPVISSPAIDDDLFD
jgi:hypothetical protein